MISKKWFMSPRHKEGSILIITVWTLFMLGIFCATLGSIVYMKLDVAAHLKDRTISYYLAWAGVQAAMKVVEEDETAYDFYGDGWCENEQFFKEVQLSAGVFNVSYDYSGIEYYGLTDEERKLNLNTASREILVSFFTVKGCSGLEAGELADSIVDWRDADTEPLPLGAEDIYYNSLEIGYNCKDAQFESVEELLLVRGMTNKIFSAIKEDVTVFGNGAVNINTANKEILQALGMTGNLANKIINYRLDHGETPIGGEDMAFENLQEIGEKIELTTEEQEITNSLTASGMITTSSNSFKAVCGGALNGGKISSEIVCVFDRTGAVEYWRQN